MAERCLKHLSAHNHKVMKGLPYDLKDEGSFLQNSGGRYAENPEPSGRRKLLPQNYKDLFAIISNVMYIC